MPTAALALRLLELTLRVRFTGSNGHDEAAEIARLMADGKDALEAMRAYAAGEGPAREAARAAFAKSWRRHLTAGTCWQQMTV